MGLLFAALPPNYRSVLGKLCYFRVLQLPLYETVLTFSGFLCRTHRYRQIGRQNQGRTLALMVTQDLLLLLLHLHWWKNSQPLLWGFPVTGTGRISVSQTTGLNVSSESTVYKTIVNLSNSTKKPTVRALKVKDVTKASSSKQPFTCHCTYTKTIQKWLEGLFNSILSALHRKSYLACLPSTLHLFYAAIVAACLDGCT